MSAKKMVLPAIFSVVLLGGSLFGTYDGLRWGLSLTKGLMA